MATISENLAPVGQLNFSKVLTPRQTNSVIARVREIK